MKRERPEDHHHHHHNHSNGIFSNHQFPLHSPPPPPPPHLRRSSTSEDTDSHDSTKQPNAPPPPTAISDGATIEVVRRPRGRPPGSKNKPKPPAPVVVSPDAPEPSMGPYILELPAGVDVVESTARFCRRRNVGLCVLSGHGVVSTVALKQPSATPGATVAFHGRFDILSISATIVPGGGLPTGNGAFTLFLAGPQGQVVGGLVVGPLISAGTVYLIAATFDSPMLVRLQPAEHEDEAEDGGHDHRESPQGDDSGGAPMYSYQPSDVIWAPTARQPPPPY